MFAELEMRLKNITAIDRDQVIKKYHYIIFRCISNAMLIKHFLHIS